MSNAASTNVAPMEGNDDGKVTESDPQVPLRSVFVVRHSWRMDDHLHFLQPTEDDEGNAVFFRPQRVTIHDSKITGHASSGQSKGKGQENNIFLLNVK